MVADVKDRGMVELTLDAQGYFARAGERFVPVGVNYWPGSSGVEMWQRWPAQEMQADLDLIRSLELNCIRFFLRWQDFEPQPGQYDEVMFERLSQFLTWCQERAIYAQPSLFVGWMSGGEFWPEWRQGRNVFADQMMVEHGIAFARRAAQVIAPYHAGLLGIDLGNELCCLPDSAQAPPAAVIGWCGSVNQAIRSVYPNALLVSGNEQNQVDNDTGWRLGAQPGTDYYSMHGYPVPAWHSVGFDGMTDPFTQSLLPTYTRVARAFGPVLLQEFGTIATFGERQQDAYLRGMLPDAWEAGANGFLWWCLRDISAAVHPYTHQNFESTLGLVDANGSVKPGLGYFIEFAKSLQGQPNANWEAVDIGLYLPRSYYPRDEPAAPQNQPRLTARALTVSRYLLKQLGLPARMVRGGLPVPETVKTLIVPGVILALDEVEALAAWVQAGGHLVWNGPDPVNWGRACVDLLAGAPVDYRAARPASIDVFGQRWTFTAYPRRLRLEVEPRGAQVLARDDEGLPFVLRSQRGAGQVTYSIPWVEETIASLAADRQARDRWAGFYAGLLA